MFVLAFGLLIRYRGGGTNDYVGLVAGEVILGIGGMSLLQSDALLPLLPIHHWPSIPLHAASLLFRCLLLSIYLFLLNSRHDSSLLYILY